MFIQAACPDIALISFSSGLTWIWTKVEPWEKEAGKPDRTAERSVGRNGKMCCNGMENNY